MWHWLLGGRNKPSTSCIDQDDDINFLDESANLSDDGEPSRPRRSQVDNCASLVVARSVADKFLIMCLLDDQIRGFYEAYSSSEQLKHLKGRLTESLLAALRRGDNDLGRAADIKLEAHSQLTEGKIERMRTHLEAAAWEHANNQSGINVRRGKPPTGEELSSRLLSAISLPLALLPKCERSETDDIKLDALKRKGGDDHNSKTVAGLDWAPLKIPMKRRRQMLGCLLASTIITECIILFVLCLIYWRWTWPFLVVYLPYIYLVEKSPWKGGSRPSAWARDNWIWRNFAQYFPVSLIKGDPNAELDRSRPVMIGYHPHGVLSFGAFLSYATNTVGWNEKFPGLTPRLATLNLTLNIPFLRDILRKCGIIAASAGSIRKALKPGNAVVLVVGGAAEALDTKPGEYVLTLSRRNGFFRIALQHGADVVPSFGFGENDIFETITSEGSWLRRFQLKAYKMLSFSMPIFYGRSIFTYNMGLLPFRRPLTVVVGNPIRVEKIENPSQENVEALKQQYIEALRELYAVWQPRLEPGREKALIVL